MKKQKGLNSNNKGIIDYDGWHIVVTEDERVEVIPTVDSRIDLLTKVLFCERFAKQRQCDLRFKLFLSRDLGRLESVLRIQSYKRSDSQVLMCRKDMALILTLKEEVDIKLYDMTHEEFTQRRYNLFPEEISSGHNECICELLIKEKIVGSGFATIKSGHMGLFNIYINEKYRSKGYGEYLLRTLFYWGRENDAKTAYLNVNENNKIAIELYKKLGFKIESEICIYEKSI